MVGPVIRTANVFLLRDGKMLVLQRATGSGAGWWYVPGGLVEDGEEVADAAARETFEETGLTVTRLELLAVDPDYDGQAWSYAHFVAVAPDGEVVLSIEHSAHAWLTPEEYVERYCSERLDAAAPQYAAFFAQIRKNCGLVSERIRTG